MSDQRAELLTTIKRQHPDLAAAILEHLTEPPPAERRRKLAHARARSGFQGRYER